MSNGIWAVGLPFVIRASSFFSHSDFIIRNFTGGGVAVKLHEFNWRRFWAIVAKEFIQMRRDRVTFAMMIGIPILQLILFGYAINSDPKHLPTAVYAADNSVFSRTIVWGLRNSSYFDIVREPKSEAEIQKLLAQGTVQFAVHIPVDFSRKLLRGERPDLLLEADATDPSAVGYAIAAINLLTTTVLDRDLTGPLAKLRGSPAAVQSGGASALQSGKHHAV